MLNAINANLLRTYQSAGQLGNQATNLNQPTTESNPFAPANANVEISEEGLALSKVQPIDRKSVV